MAQNAVMTATIVQHAAEGMHDKEFLSAVKTIVERIKTQAAVGQDPTAAPVKPRAGGPVMTWAGGDLEEAIATERG